MLRIDTNSSVTKATAREGSNDILHLNLSGTFIALVFGLACILAASILVVPATTLLTLAAALGNDATTNNDNDNGQMKNSDSDGQTEFSAGRCMQEEVQTTKKL